MDEGSSSVFALFILAAAVTAGVAILRLPPLVKVLLVTGLWLRVLGARLYREVMERSYGGVADYNLYFDFGAPYAEAILSGAWSDVIDPWFEPGWYGTFATARLTGLVLYVVGATEFGAFLVFAYLGYIGIVAFWRAYELSFPGIESTRYLAFVVLFPSLWFWPAAVGKDSVVLCGIGLATWGFAGRTAARGWIMVAIGLFLIFIIRPQVAAVVVSAMAVSQFLAAGLELRLLTIVRLIFLVGIATATLIWSSQSMGVEFYDPEEVQEYLEAKSEASNIGGSAIDVQGGAGVSPLLAPINTLFRPFPWEARGFSNLIAAAEVGVLWLLVAWRRRVIWSFFKERRRSALFWMAVVFTLGYSVALGMTLTNIGIIARQRVHIFPFLFMLLAAGARRVEPLVNEPLPAEPLAAAPTLLLQR